MVSSQTPEPLRSSFTRLSISTYLHEPTSSSSQNPRTSSTQDPQTVLLFAWGAAPPKNIVKYTAQYTKLYPSSRLLLFTTQFADLIFHTPTSQSAALAPSVDLLRGLDPSTQRRTLVHLFSNGGSYKLVELARLYRKTTGQRLPIGALIFDSAPGRPHYVNSIAAMKTVLPKPLPLRLLGLAVVYAYICGLWLWHMLFGGKAITQRVWEALNDPELIDPSAERVYMASRSDDMVEFEDVVAHAEEARERGCEATVEEFVGSKHVAHARVDGERYWEAVRGVWARRKEK